MPSNDRKGKWQPFDALSGFRHSLEEVNYKKEKCQKPILSADKCEQINESLQLAFAYNYEVIVKYYTDGYIRDLSGFITKVEAINRQLIIDNKTINFNNIIDIVIK